MQSRIARCYLETYPLQGVTTYVDEVHEPQPELSIQQRHALLGPRELILQFFALSAIRQGAHGLQGPANAAQTIKNVLLNLAGYQEHGPRWWRWLNTVLMIPTFIYHLGVLPLKVILNVLKLVTEFMPRVAAVFLLDGVKALESKTNSMVVTRCCYAVLAMTGRVCLSALSLVRFFSRAITAPGQGIAIGWRIGNALGNTQLGLDKQGRTEMEYTVPGQIMGMALAILSAGLSLAVYMAILPLIFLHFGLLMPAVMMNCDWYANYCGVVMDPLLNGLTYFVGMERICQWLNVVVLEDSTQPIHALRSLGLLALLEPLGTELFSLDTREWIKDAASRVAACFYHFEPEEAHPVAHRAKHSSTAQTYKRMCNLNELLNPVNPVRDEIIAKPSDIIVSSGFAERIGLVAPKLRSPS